MCFEKPVDELKELGKKHPFLLKRIFEASNLNNLEFEVLKSRYIDGLLFKQIEFRTGRSERQIYRCHKSGIRKTVDRFNMAGLLDFMCQYKGTMPPL